MGDHSRYLYPRFFEDAPVSSDPKTRQRYKLLESARTSVGGKSKIKFAECIEKEEDFSILTDILETLDAQSIPPSPLDISNPSARGRVERVLAATHNLAVVFDSLERLPSQSPDSFSGRSFGMLLERWAQVVKWMAYVIVNAPAAANDDNIVVVFAHTLNQILRHTTAEGAHKEELRSIPYTSNLICILLCRTSSSRRYYFASQTASDPCIIVSVLDGFVRLKDGRHYFQSQVKCLSRNSRRKVLESLVLRPQFFLSDPHTDSRLEASLVTMELLVRALKSILKDSALMAECLQLGLVSEFSTAFDLFCRLLTTNGPPHARANKNSWRALFAGLISFFQYVVLNLVKDRRRAFRTMKCRLVTCALQCMLHMDDNIPDKNKALGFILTDTVNYLTYSDVYRALAPEYPRDLIAQVRARDISKEVNSNCLRFEQRFVLAMESFDNRKDIPINMCSNLKHHLTPTASPSTPELNQRLRTCSRCHTAMYCSKECQEEDWRAFHSQECSHFAKLHDEQKLTHEWISVSVRRDHLAYLEHLTNNLTSGVVKSDWKFIKPPKFEVPDDPALPNYQPSSTISLFDTSQYNILSALPLHPLTHHHHLFWRRINPPSLEPRVQAFVSDMEEKPDDIILAEGIFAFDADYSIFVLAKMSFDAERPLKERYKIVNSVWRMGPKLLSWDLWSKEGGPEMEQEGVFLYDR